MSLTVNAYIKQLGQILLPSYDSLEIATQNAWNLLEFCTKKSHAKLLASPVFTLSTEQEELLQECVYQITVLKKPIQYIIGHVPFLDLTIKVASPILIPRPETEEWCSQLIEIYKQHKNRPTAILDVCTGTGCIALALAQAFPTSLVIGGDINEQALNLARENQRINGIKNCTFIHSNLFEKMEKRKFDLIVSNPPYISRREWQDLDAQVAWWEDPRALVAEDDGYHIIIKILKEAKQYLVSHPLELANLWIEIGSQQGPIVQVKALEMGYKKATIYKDLHHKDRVVMITY